MNEQELRDMKTPWPESEEELLDFIRTVSEEGGDYGKAVYVMSHVATAAFYYASHLVESSGFQSSCAELDFLQRTRGYKHGFRVIDFENLLYPQYERKVPGYWDLIAERREELGEAAASLLADKEGGMVSDGVKKHWKLLVRLGKTA